MEIKYLLLIDAESLIGHFDDFDSVFESLPKEIYRPLERNNSSYSSIRHYIVRSTECPIELLNLIYKKAPKCEFYLYGPNFAVSSQTKGYIIPKLKDADTDIIKLCERVSKRHPDLTEFPIYETSDFPLGLISSHRRYLDEMSLKSWYPKFEDEERYGKYFEKYFEERHELINSHIQNMIEETGRILGRLTLMPKGEMDEFVVVDDIDRNVKVAIATSMIAALSPVENENSHIVEVLMINGYKFKTDAEMIVKQLNRF